MMNDAIRNFAQQFEYEPRIEHGDVPKKSGAVVLGMGGSHLAADLLTTWKPELPLTIHSDYGLPAMSAARLADQLVIASSYSGNTEEVLDGFEAARARGLPLVAIAVGGKLLALAKEHSVPYVQLPDTGIQPRSALGFSVLALLKVLGEEDGLREAAALAGTLQPDALEDEGKGFAERFRGTVPVIYAATRNRPIAYNWKIKLNETGKIPALYNVFPELNHNEMNGFDVQEATRPLSERFRFVFLKDPADHPRVAKRMETVEKLYADRGLAVEIATLSGATAFERMFRSLLVADWFAFHTAEGYGLESEQVPMIEEFKRLIA